MREELGVALFLVTASFMVIESVSMMLWRPWFYRSAPRLWRVVVAPVALESPSELAIADIANRTLWRPLVFQRLPGGGVAFRESYYSFRLPCGICGLISEDSAAQTLTITTRCSLTLVVILSWAAIGAIANDSVGSAFVTVVLIAMFLGQRLRLRAIARAIGRQDLR